MSVGAGSLSLAPRTWTRTARSTATEVDAMADVRPTLWVGWRVVGSRRVAHQPWDSASAVAVRSGFHFSNQILPPLYGHLVAQPQCWFWWSRWSRAGAGTTTNVWCYKCGDNWEYGGAVDVKAYVWASEHACRSRAERGPVMGEECSRLFR